MSGSALRRAAIGLLLVLAGCGGGDGDGDAGGRERAEEPRRVPPGAVALVGEQAIPREEFERWLAIAAAQHDPDDDRGVPAPGDPGYASLRDQTMQFLVGSEWVEQEAAAQGVQAGAAEVRRSFDEQKEESFPRERDYRRFLRTTRQTEEDVLFRVRVDLLSTRLGAAAGGSGPGSQEALDKFVAGFRQKYRGRTLCAEGFETADCSNGPETAGGSG